MNADITTSAWVIELCYETNRAIVRFEGLPPEIGTEVFIAKPPAALTAREQFIWALGYSAGREVPDGYRLLPIDPTPKMVSAHGYSSAFHDWHAMLRAAPDAPQRRPPPKSVDAMDLHPGCEHACQQAQDYGVWPEHRCSPKCVYLGDRLRESETPDKAKLPDKS